MTMTSETDLGLGLILEPLPYQERLQKRTATDIDLVVVHCTELPDMKMAREYGERVLYEAGTGASGHYYIDRDGCVFQYVDPLHIANHTRGYNPRSIGIEIVNIGRYPDWLNSNNQVMTEPYRDEQINVLKKLLLNLKSDYPNLQFIAGHEDLDTAKVQASDDPGKQVFRKRDPGPQFPWQEILSAVQLKRITQETP
ncbi:MAG: N-acetylmuramoyl-L-alanine amidase [Arenimonas sp.]